MRAEPEGGGAGRVGRPDCTQLDPAQTAVSEPVGDAEARLQPSRGEPEVSPRPDGDLVPGRSIVDAALPYEVG